MRDVTATFVRYVMFPLWAAKDGSPNLRALRELESSQFLPLDELKARQLARLQAILVYAAEKCPFYKKRFDAVDFNPRKFEVEDFSRIPPLTKADVRAHRDEMIAVGFPRSHLIAKKTGGSTGVPLQFFIDTESNGRKNAYALRHKKWAGWYPGDRVAMIWGAHDPQANWRARLRNLLLDRAIALDTLRLDMSMMHSFAFQMRSFHPKVLFGHSHSMYMLTVFLRKHGYEIPSVKTIVSTSTVLTDTERRLMEEFFGCKVFDRYGCEEVSLIAGECERHQGMHLNIDHLFVEFLAGNRAAQPNECGEIYVTDLINQGMPFIRYRVEDAATPSDRACSCGRSLPLIDGVQGRIADFIVTPEGRIIFGVSILDNFTAKHLSLERVQIVQDRIDHLLFRVVRSEDFDATKFAAFRAAIPAFFGPTMKADFEFVETIPREPSGKYRFTISEIANPLEEAAQRTLAGAKG